MYKTNSASPFSKHSLRANPGDSLPLPSPSLPPPPFIKEGLFWDLPGDTAGSMDSIRGGKTEITHAVSDNGKWQPTPVFLPGEFYGQRSLVGYSPWGHKELDTTESERSSCGVHIRK